MAEGLTTFMSGCRAATQRLNLHNLNASASSIARERIEGSRKARVTRVTRAFFLLQLKHVTIVRSVAACGQRMNAFEFRRQGQTPTLRVS